MACTWLLDVARGVWEQCELRIDYRSKSGPSSQVVRPLGLVLKSHAWYLARPGRLHRMVACLSRALVRSR